MKVLFMCVCVCVCVLVYVCICNHCPGVVKCVGLAMFLYGVHV